MQITEQALQCSGTPISLYVRMLWHCVSGGIPPPAQHGLFLFRQHGQDHIHRSGLILCAYPPYRQVMQLGVGHICTAQDPAAHHALVHAVPQERQRQGAVCIDLLFR